MSEDAIGGYVTENVLASDFKAIYSNTLRLGLTPYDLFMVFGRIKESKPGQAFNDEQCEVRMSPQFFKTMVHQLNGLLRTYETQFGEVRISNQKFEEVLASVRSSVKTQP